MTFRAPPGGPSPDVWDKPAVQIMSVAQVLWALAALITALGRVS